jgi:hypothetical protein
MFLSTSSQVAVWVEVLEVELGVELEVELALVSELVWRWWE